VAREPSVEAVRASIPPQAPPVAATPAAADRAATSPAAPVASPAPGPPAASGQTAAAAPAPASASSRPSWWSFSTWMSWPWSSSRPAPATETAAAAPAAKPAAPGRRARTPGAIQAAGNAVSATIPPGEPAQPAEPAPTAPAVPLAAALSSAAAVPTNRSNPDPPALAPIDESTEAYIFGTIEPNVPVYSKANSEVVPPDLVRPQLLPPIFAPKVGAAVNQMELTISTAGAVERARFLVGPHRMADMMILSSAKTWRFTPASKDGQPVRYRTVVAFEAGP